MPTKINIIGKDFGRLIVKGDVPRIAGERRKVLCDCACGKEIEVDPRSLTSGHTKSCGCLQKEFISKYSTQRNKTHGQSKSSEYNIWCHMRSRCSNPNNTKYKDYGLRGIKVCAKWKNNFESFYQDMGQRPTNNHSIDRIDVNGNYTKDNCRWALPAQQANNKRNHRVVEYKGSLIPLSVACKQEGVNYRAALWRLNNNKHWLSIPKPPKTKEYRQDGGGCQRQ